MHSPTRLKVAERRPVEVELGGRKLATAHGRRHDQIDESRVPLRAEAADRAAHQLREPLEMQVAVDRPGPGVAEAKTGYSSAGHHRRAQPDRAAPVVRDEGRVPEIQPIEEAGDKSRLILGPEREVARRDRKPEPGKIDRHAAILRAQTFDQAPIEHAPGRVAVKHQDGWPASLVRVMQRSATDRRVVAGEWIGARRQGQPALGFGQRLVVHWAMLRTLIVVSSRGASASARAVERCLIEGPSMLDLRLAPRAPLLAPGERAARRMGRLAGTDPIPRRAGGDGSAGGGDRARRGGRAGLAHRASPALHRRDQRQGQRPHRRALSGLSGRPRRPVHLSRARAAGGLCHARPQAPPARRARLCRRRSKAG